MAHHADYSKFTCTFCNSEFYSREQVELFCDKYCKHAYMKMAERDNIQAFHDSRWTENRPRPADD